MRDETHDLVFRTICVLSRFDLFLLLLAGRVVIELPRSAEQPVNCSCNITVGSLQSLDCMFLIETHGSNLRHLARILHTHTHTHIHRYYRWMLLMCMIVLLLFG